ncbi:MAG: MBL fold metallo-hydrolase, partial [Clostridia bacterium]|nr:MBL fold metallo-hydrolase [Clostridia bacterium]
MQKLPIKLTDKLYILGQDLFLTYLVLGNPCTLLDLGVSGSVPLLEEQLRKLGVKNEDIGHLVVLHAHWDHVCGLPYMKKIFPNAQVWGSPKAREVLAKEKIVNQFRINDEKYCTRLLENGEFDSLPPFLPYETMAVENLIEDGQTLNLGGVDIHFLATPGHSACALTAYLPSEKAVIMSDAVGCYYDKTDEYLAMYYQGFQLTLDSLEKVRYLDADIVGYCHDTEMIYYGKEAIAKMYRRIEEKLLGIRAEAEKMV